MKLRSPVFICIMLLLLSSAGGLRADPILGPPVEQSGLRFETWLADPKIVIPDKHLVPKKNIPVTLFSVRVTNLLSKPVRFDPYMLDLMLVKPNGKKLFADEIRNYGRMLQPQEEDYIVLQPQQSLVVPRPSFLEWRGDRLDLSWPSPIAGNPWTYPGLVAGTYQFTIEYRMPTPTVPIRDDNTNKIVKTLDGFWTGDVTLPPMKFKLIAGN
ncbi:MAG: hypothetical protein ACRYFS_12390 [Janthinobacterium lividum]